MKMKKLPIIATSLSLFLTVGVSLVFAQTGGGGGPSIGVQLDNPFGGNGTLFTLVRAIVNDIVLPVGGVLAVLAFIYSGFLYITAQGSEDKLKTAHKSLLYTSIGTAVLLGAWVLANVICTTIGLIGGPACLSQ